MQCLFIFMSYIFAHKIRKAILLFFFSQYIQYVDFIPKSFSTHHNGEYDWKILRGQCESTSTFMTRPERRRAVCKSYKNRLEPET